MASATVAHSIQLYVAGFGTPSGAEGDLITAVRSRLNGKFASIESADIQVRAFVYGVHPIVLYLRRCVMQEQLQRLSASEFADTVHRIFELVATRTRLSSKFSKVLELDEPWLKVQDALQLMRGASRRGRRRWRRQPGRPLLRHRRLHRPGGRRGAALRPFSAAWPLSCSKAEQFLSWRGTASWWSWPPCCCSSARACTGSMASPSSRVPLGARS